LLKIILLKISLGKRRVLLAKNIPLEVSMVLHETMRFSKLKGNQVWLLNSSRCCNFGEESRQSEPLCEREGAYDARKSEDLPVDVRFKAFG